YFATGVIAAIAVYSAFKFRGKTRWAIAVTLLASLTFVAGVWGPIFMETRHQVMGLANFGVMPNRSIVHSTLDVPHRLAYGPIGPLIWPTFLLSMIFGTVGNVEWLVYLPLALLVYVSPLLRWRRQPELMLWWLWAIGSVAVVMLLDITRHSALVSNVRYVFLASPAVYAIFAAPLPTRIGQLLPIALLLGTVGYCIQQVRTIQQPWEQTRAAAMLVSQHVHPGEAVILTGGYQTQPAFEYFYIAHYLGEWKNPIVLITNPQADDLQRLSYPLAKYPNVWMFGSTQLDRAGLPPQWHVRQRFSSQGGDLWLIAP
ncbi:MAG: hypothetical protein ABSH08_06040, partial [Tepidisphaeraceae bacterium]